MSSDHEPIRLPSRVDSTGIHSLQGKYAHSGTQFVLHRFLTLLFICVLFAIVAGYAGALFRLSVVWANDFRHVYPWLLYFLPLGGLVIAYLYHQYKTDTRNSFAIMTQSVQTGEPIPAIASPLVWFSTFVTHLLGGSAGCEGASLMIGGGIGSTAGRLFRLNQTDSELIVLCGMAAAFAPLLGTPIAAAVFVVELTKQFSRSRLLMATVSAMVAYGAVLPLGLHPIHFALTLPEYSFSFVGQIIVIALAGAGCAWLLRHGIEAVTTFRIQSGKPGLTIVVGSILVIVLTLIIGTFDYNGLGLDAIAKAFDGHATPDAFVWKLVLTVITMGIGFKGGQIVPAFFIGSTLGCVLAGIFGLDPAVGAAIGMISVFAGVVQCPFAAIVMGMEIFGFMTLPIFVLGIGIVSGIRVLRA